METVYADLVLLLNTAVDYLVLLGAGKLCALPLRRLRMGLGALWGGAYALACALWPQYFALVTAKLLAGAVMTLIAFGLHRSSLRAVIAVYAVSAAFGGAVYAAAHLAGSPGGQGGRIPVSMRVLLLSFALSYAAVSLVFRRVGRRTARTVCPVALRLGTRRAEFTALVDSGNELSDPLTGDPVLIAASEALAPLFDDPAPLSLRDGPAMLAAFAARGLRIRLIPCTCVTAEAALLPCFRPDEVRIDGKTRTMLVGISPVSLTPDGSYSAIVPLD